jgi:uncharacterized protein involved in high-affinity Fe2+ transport
MINNRLIQALWDKANSSGTDMMRWSDFLNVLTELKNTDTTAYTENPMSFDDLPEYADDAAAVLGGLAGGEFYRDADGIVRQRLPDV